MSPRMLMTGQQMTTKNVQFQFCDFVQSTQPPRAPNTVNTMDERTSDSIYCFPSGNAQGGFWVYKLSTNQIVHRNSATLAHSTDTVAMQIEAIAANENTPDGLTFVSRSGAHTTIYDYKGQEVEHDDDISDDEYSDASDQELEDDHNIDDDYFEHKDVASNHDEDSALAVPEENLGVINEDEDSEDINGDVEANINMSDEKDDTQSVNDEDVVITEEPE